MEEFLELMKTASLECEEWPSYCWFQTLTEHSVTVPHIYHLNERSLWIKLNKNNMKIWISTLTQYIWNPWLPFQQSFPVFKCQNCYDWLTNNGKSLRFFLEKETAFKAQEMFEIDWSFRMKIFGFSHWFLVEFHYEWIGYRWESS